MPRCRCLASPVARVPEGVELLRDSGTRAEPTEQLTVVSWNMHYAYGPTMDRGRGQSRGEVLHTLDELARHIRSFGADVVGLQEIDRAALRSHDVDQLRWLMQATGLHHAAWCPTWDCSWVPYPGRDPRRHIGRVWSGQAVLSRLPLTRASRAPLPQPRTAGRAYNLFYLHRALLDVVADLGGGRRLRITNAHLEAFDTPNKEEHARLTARHLDPVPPFSLLLGDMNCVAPEARLRAAFPDEPETDMSTDRTIHILAGIPGLSEVLTPCDPVDEARYHSFPADAPNRRLDYIFHGSGLHCLDARVPRLPSPPSDHLPVVARFELQ